MRITHKLYSFFPCSSALTTICYFLILSDDSQILIQLEDNRLIETVGIPVEDDKGSIRLTACVSSQVKVKDLCKTTSCIKSLLKTSFLFILLGFYSESILISPIGMFFLVVFSFFLQIYNHFSFISNKNIQVGCPLRCSFCATGKGGYSRNLQRHEIIEQVV